MVICLNTGMHRLFDDSKAYYHYAAGTGVEAGKWFVKNKVKCVAMDGQALDHPLHTAMSLNGMTRMDLLGATGDTLINEYKKLFGETIVIRDMTGSDRGGFPGMSRPGGAMGMPSGMPGGMQKNMSTPSDMDMLPEGKMPEMSGGPSGADGPEGAGQPPQSRDNERTEAR